MVAPSGEQHEISGDGYRAVVTEGGGALRVLSHEGRDLVDGFGPDGMSSGGRGQLLVPWPNRIRDGRYTFDGRDLQLPLTEPSRRNASHGLVRWAPFTVERRTASSVELRSRLMAQSGYPWALDVRVSYAVTPDGLIVTLRSTNLAPEPAPYAQGAHPYLTVGPGPCDGWELTLPAATRLLADPERKLPTGREPVTGTPYDFRGARAIGASEVDHAFTDLARSPDGRATVLLRDPGTGHAVELWMDAAHDWVMVFTGDEPGSDTHRRAVAVEPMTAPPDAFRSGDGLRVLAPGETFEATWGIRAPS